MSDLLQRFGDFIVAGQLFNKEDHLLIAVSGGLDSVVLCELCHRAGYDFVMAHCNFGLRGDESNRDEQFVSGLGQKYSRPVLVRHFDTTGYAKQHKCSIQVAARELRYAWFNELLQGTGLSQNFPSGLETRKIRFLLTAHHLDDNIETLLNNFFKGTGISGLVGILPKQGQIIRPLLFAKKEELKAFALASGLHWMEDSSNESEKYTRNYIRRQIIPLLEKIYPSVTDNLAANLGRFREVELIYRQSIDQIKKKLLFPIQDEIHIPVLKLAKTEPLRTVIYEIIRHYGFGPSQIDDLLKLLSSESGKYIQSDSHRILKNRNWLIISPLKSAQAQTLLVEESDEEVAFPGGSLRISIHAADRYTLRGRPEIAELDASGISFPLLLRKWKPGDYFYPLGMKKKKKLSRFFIDQKLSGSDKEKIWVLEMNKKILWVLGMRIDERFKITPNTSKVLLIEMRMG